MQIPPLDDFRQENGIACGLPWSVDPEGADFTLTIPDGDGDWVPHEPSHRMAMDVLPELDALKAKAVEYLERIVDFGKRGLAGEPYLIHVQVDARAERVTIEMVWETDIHAGWSVTFSWREEMRRWPVGMAFCTR